MSLIDNERTKLLANAFDRASTPCFTVGIATPLAGYLYNVGNFRAGGQRTLLVWWPCRLALAALIRHFLARQALKGLKP